MSPTQSKQNKGNRVKKVWLNIEFNLPRLSIEIRLSISNYFGLMD